LGGRFAEKRDDLSTRLYELCQEDGGRQDPTHLLGSWAGLTRPQRLLALNYAERMGDFHGTPFWYEVPEVTSSLLRGDTQWTAYPAVFRFRAELPTWPQLHALHGILLPGGLVNWDPMMGSSARISLLPVPGGLQLDARGSSAPSPTASRLFVDRVSAEAVAVPFARALLHHAQELCELHLGDQSWRTWFDDLLQAASGLLFWPQAICLEMPFLEETVGYRLRGRPDRATGQALIQEFGNWIPSRLFDARYGGDPWTTAMLAMRPKRMSDDVVEVDMEAAPRTSAQTLKTALGAW